MNKQYDVEFKKEIVYEYLKDATLNDIFKSYEVPKSTVNGWIKKYSEECPYTKPQTKEKLKLLIMRLKLQYLVSFTI